MGKKMVRNLRSGAAIALLLGATFVAQAAGLGKLTVNSALGQILNAEIDLVSLQPGELDSLSARVAAPEAFRDARVEYSPSLRLLRFSVEKRTNGQAYLKVTSVAPVNEPFVDVLIEVTWPAGRIQREYPILLDPPGYAQGRVALPAATAATSPRAETPPDAAPAVSPPTPASTETTGTGTPSASAEMPSSGATAPAASVTTAGSDTYGPVQRGETLRKIAEQVKPSTVSMEQMLVSLYRENKAAFAGNNMNRLKTGQILKVPSAEDVAQIESRDANQEIRTQVADWKSYRDTLAGGVASLPSRPDTSNAASGRVASAAVTPPPPPSTPGTDVLKLSRTDSGKSASGKGGAGSQDRVNALQEEVTAKDKALKESQSRVADLEKQIRDMQRLLDLSKSVAAKAADTKVAAAPVPVPAPPPAKAEPPKVAEVKPVDVPKPVEAPPVAEAPKPEPPKVAEAPKTEEVKPPVDSAKAAAKKKAPPPPAKEWYEDIDPIYMALGGAVVIGIPLAAFLFIRRRKRRAEAGPSSSMTSAFPSDLKPNTNTGKAGGGLVDTGNSSFLTDFDKTGPGTIDTDEVDPVAEAEVYIAYGRDAQAEEILKEAMARDKNRHEIALKLLEIYHARKSATAFETVAKELRAAVGDSHPLWQKAAAMGAQIDPSNPLYGSVAAGTATFTAMSPASAAAPAKPNLDFDLDGGANVSATEAHGSAPAPDFDLDLDGDKKTSSEAAPDLPTESSSIDFDLAPSAPAAAPAADVHAGEAKEEKPACDFDLSGLDFPSSKPAEAPAPAPAPSGGGSMDLADLSLDAPTESGGEAVGTKLELAKAYLEIGDKDGAREILKEVAKEGSSAQREEASKLIASL